MKLLKYIIDKKTWLMGKINNPIHCHGFFYVYSYTIVRTPLESNSNILKKIISIKTYVSRLMALYRPM